MLEVDDPADLEIIGLRRSGTETTRPLWCRSPACSTGPSSGRACPPAMSPGLDETSYFEPPQAAYSFGTAAAVVSVDAEIGRVRASSGS